MSRRVTFVAMISMGLLLLGYAGMAAAEDAMFPFVVSYDAPQNVTNVAAWLDGPAGKHGPVRAENGHLATDAGPLRLWATNFCFEACFPSHEQAERVAARLARFGINCVRMHHMDARSIWGDSPNKLTIDPKKIERLDYLIYQLKLHGIYTDINLHVSRFLGEAEGFVAQDQRPDYDKGLGNFEPRMIELQKKYARDLLTHVNPYTKSSYAREPAVAMVEISNEDALFTVWGWNQLDRLPEPYATTYRKVWNTWLRKKYGNTERLQRAWNAGQWPLGGELLRNGDFAQPLGQTWNVERDDQTDAQATITADGPEGRPSLRLTVVRQGRELWRPQLSQAGFAVKKGTPYTLTFDVRADQSRNIDVNCMMAHEPWQRLGFSDSADLGTQWKRQSFTFVAAADDPNARITVTGLRPGTYELANVSLRPGGIVGLAKDQQLEDDTVPVVLHGRLNTTEAARSDFVDFLWDTERDYWWGMYRLLKDELGVVAPVSGTQLLYGPVHIQAGLDYLDAHSYWKHPTFPGRSWDRNDWYVENVALVNSLGETLTSLASRRVAGMAYTVSEYNHPEPNQYAAEGFPMIAALGAFQAWDGIFSFAYSHDSNFEPRKADSFFDIRADTARLVHMPACAALFLRGDMAPAKTTVLAPLSRQAEMDKLHETLSPHSLNTSECGLDARLPLLHAVALDLSGRAKVGEATDLASVKTFVSDTGQMRWDVSQPGAGFFTVDTPHTKVFSGFVGGRTFALGNVKLEIGKTQLDWATVSIVSIDRTALDRPGRLLVAATGAMQNTGAQLEQLGGTRVTLRSRWGTEPVVCEGIPARITLPLDAGRATCHALDESGNRGEAVAVGQEDGKALLEIGPRYKTVWYEVEIK